MAIGKASMAKRCNGVRFFVSLSLAGICLFSATSLRAELVLTNYNASKPLKVMAVGDSITDDCAINGAWRLYLQPLLQANGYAFTNLGRWVSSPTPGFT